MSAQADQATEQTPGQVPFIEPYPGLKYRERRFVIDAAEQKRLLNLCGIDPAIFGEEIDPIAFITLAIREGVRNGVSANGAVNMAQTITMHRPLSLGEEITVRGGILSVDEVPRGRVAFSETWLCMMMGTTSWSEHVYLSFWLIFFPSWLKFFLIKEENYLVWIRWISSGAQRF